MLRSPESELQRSRAVAEACYVQEAEGLKQTYEYIGHWCPIRCFDMEPPSQRAVRVSGEKQRTAFMIVKIRVAHR